jgi:GntR family transcriptional regulator
MAMTNAVRVRKQTAAQQVVEILTDRIRCGEYTPEMRLPSEDGLAEELGVSRTTIRSALDVLAGQHLVFRRHGVGTFVSNLSRIANPLNQAVLFQDLIRANGHEPGILWLSAQIVPADAALARLLQVPADHPTLEVRKVFTADGEPVIYCANYIPAWVLGPALLDEVLADPTIEEPLFEFLEGPCGHRAVYFVAKLCPERIADAGFEISGLGPDLPALKIDEIGYDDKERPVVRSIHHYPGQRMDFVFVRRFYNGASAAW